MSTRQRVQRIGEEIKKEAAEIIRQMKDPRIGFATITDVEVTNDLRHVRIYVSVYGDDEEKERTLAGLQAAKGFVRTELGRTIRLRHTPEVVFKLDGSIEQGARINQIINEISSDQRPSESEPTKPAEDET